MQCRAHEPYRERDVSVAFRDLRPQQRRPRKSRDLAARLAQQLPGGAGFIALQRGCRELAQIVRSHRARRRRFDPTQFTIDPECLPPLMLALIDAAKRIERTGTQTRDFAHLLEQSLRSIEKSGPQIVLGKSQQRLFPVLRCERLARQQILMDTDGTLDFAAAPIERAERKVRFERIGVGIHQFQEHVERPIGLLGHEIVKSREIIGMQFR